jgi:hypothetical protein
MRHATWKTHPWILLAAAAVAAAGCSTDPSHAVGASQTRVSLSQGALPAPSAATGLSADFTGGPPGLIAPATVDSLTVTVDSVQVLPDSELALRHRGEPWGPPGADSVVHRLGGGPFGPGGPGGEGFGGREHFPFGPGGMRDSLRQRDSTALCDSLGWGKLNEDWYTLEVAGNGHLDLLHLPTDTTSGLQLAVGAVPAGSYGGARLFVSAATIWFNATVVSHDSDFTFLPNVGYPVTIPSGPKSGIRTRAGFTIPDGASEVLLVFDVDAAIRHAVATHDGKIRIVPEMGGSGHRR